MNAPSATALERLQTVRTADDLLRYFIEELDWPLEDEAMLEDEDVDDLTFDWDLEELGVPRLTRARIARVRQVRPFTADQPWGIFFVDLAGERLLITRLRGILNTLIRRRRGAGDADLRSWTLENLLFVVTTGSGESTELHVLVFFDEESKVEFRCLSWRPADSTLRMRRLAEELLPRLGWPDDEKDTEAWRAAWRSPFTLRPGQVIDSASRLADRMARTARDLRDQIAEALNDEDGQGPFSELMDHIRQQLVADVDGERFADMCAQTLVYGLLGSRVSDPDGFGATPILSAVPLSNPFLSAFFEQVHGEAATLDLEGSGLDQLIADLRVTDVEAILDEFGSTVKGGDPVIHFYEEFLKKYDRKMRADAGAFYTPEPVVEFMVRGVDEILKTRFGLEAGIADRATWQDVAERVGFDIPEGVAPEKPFISMIDPATGTGTYLAHWLRQAKRSFETPRHDESWRQHLSEVVLPSMHAFELMLGPYTVAHLKLALRLHDEGLPTDTAQILLTDTLDHDPPQLSFDLEDNPVAAEGRKAADLKQDERFTVVIGNPPWHRALRALGDEGRRKGGVVRHGAAGINPLIEGVIQPMREAGLGVHVQPLYNIYVYFWRWAIWQAAELPPGPGIVAFITASSYLDGVSMGGVRALLRHTFDEILIVDLGGDSRGALPEENVFDIRTPVAIALCVRSGIGTADSCAVHYLRLTGSRREKLERLRNLSHTDVEIKVPGEKLTPLVPRSMGKYWYWPALTDVFPWHHPGANFHRTWPVGPTKALVRRRWKELVKATPRRRARLLKETRDRTIHTNPKSLYDGSVRLRSISRLDRDDWPEAIERYGYRSFDRQWAIADHRVADMPRPVLWRINSELQMFLTAPTSARLGRGQVLTATPYPPDLNHSSGRGGRVIPIYRDRAAAQANVTNGALAALGGELGKPIAVEDLCTYVYALLGTSAFSERFGDKLAELAGSVHIPITSDAGLFERAVELGRDLLWCHTWGEGFQPAGTKNLPQSDSHEVSPIDGYPNTYRYRPYDQTLEVGTGSFGPVSQDVWDFEVSGLKVLRSWLGYRMAQGKGRKSSPLDDIRPRTWVFTDELLHLITILQHTIDVTPAAVQLLDEIVNGPPLLLATDLPKPTEAERKPPKV